ncbi:hypothetical protein EON81_19375 [bacterium]|nr:MAG: hypothetical protein EON81_19375 [bacterium]
MTEGMGDKTEGAERILCDEGLRVAVGGLGDRVVVDVRDGTANRFWTDTSNLEKALHGEAVRIDAHGGYCVIEVREGTGRLDLVMEGVEHKHCDFSTGDLADAIAMVREQSDPEGSLVERA